MARTIGGQTPTRPQQDVSKVEGRKPVAGAPSNRVARHSPAGTRGVPRQLRTILEAWPEASRLATLDFLSRYGPPDEHTSSHVVWYKVGPWKRTIVWRDGAAHEFPRPHRDVVEQVVDFEPPIDKFDEIARFNGSLTLSRTRGELSSRCEDERMNFLLCNLANDIAHEVRTLDEARTYVAERVLSPRRNEPEDFLVGLQFAVDVGDVGDPDEDAVGSTTGEEEDIRHDEEATAQRRVRSSRAHKGIPGRVRRRPTTGARGPSTL